MVIGSITLLAMSVFSYVIWKWQEGKRILSAFIYGQMYFWSAYILICAFLMWLDKFRILFAAVGTLCASLTVALICHRAYGKEYRRKENHEIWVKQDIYALLLCILIAASMRDKNELMGLSQDEGVYQTIAISYMEDNNSNQKRLEEYEVLDEEDQSAFLNRLMIVISQGMHGYYLHCEDYIPRNMQQQYSAVSGYYHGVPTYAATLAIWGSIFGWKQMMGVQSLFYILAVLLFYELIRQTSLSMGKQILLLALYALSPIMIWLGKSSLTELLLTCLINWFLYELLSEKSRDFRAIRIALPIMTFAFVHLTIYTLMPMIIVCLLIRFWDERGIVFLKSGLYISAGYLAGILFTAWCYTEYFYLNVKFLTQLIIFNDENVLTILCLCGVISAAVFVALYFYKKKLPLFSTAQRIWGVRIVVVTFTIVSAWIVLNAILTGGQWEKRTIISYIALTGIVILPAVLAFLIKKTKIFCLDKKNRIITWFFLYCVLLYATLFRKEIINHYYGDRYLAPFFVGIFLMVAVIIEHISIKRLGRYLLALCSLVSLGYLVVHDSYIIKHKDDTRIEWNILEEICDKLDEDDILILGDYQMISCFFPIRDLTGAFCYPVFGEDIQDTIDKLLLLKRDIYVLAAPEELPQDSKIVGEWEVRYMEYAGEENAVIFDPLKIVDVSSVGMWRMIKK